MRYFACAQYDRVIIRAECGKGVRGESPNIDSEDCGEQVDFQGEAGGKILAKIEVKL